MHATDVTASLSPLGLFVHLRYALGVIAYEFLSGCESHPYMTKQQFDSQPEGTSLEQWMAMHIATSPGVCWRDDLKCHYDREAPELVALVEALLCRLQRDRAGMKEVRT